MTGQGSRFGAVQCGGEVDEGVARVGAAQRKGRAVEAECVAAGILQVVACHGLAVGVLALCQYGCLGTNGSDRPARSAVLLQVIAIVALVDITSSSNGDCTPLVASAARFATCNGGYFQCG